MFKTIFAALNLLLILWFLLFATFMQEITMFFSVILGIYLLVIIFSDNYEILMFANIYALYFFSVFILLVLADPSELHGFLSIHLVTNHLFLAVILAIAQFVTLIFMLDKFYAVKVAAIKQTTQLKLLATVEIISNLISTVNRESQSKLYKYLFAKKRKVQALILDVEAVQTSDFSAIGNVKERHISEAYKAATRLRKHEGTKSLIEYLDNLMES